MIVGSALTAFIWHRFVERDSTWGSRIGGEDGFDMNSGIIKGAPRAEEMGLSVAVMTDNLKVHIPPSVATA